MRQSPLFLAAAAVGCLIGQWAAVAKEPIQITVDRAKVMRISQPAATIIIGNPAIADATVQSDQMLVITGKSYGVTNLIVLDIDGNPIADEILNVRAAEDLSVTLYRGVRRETLNCAPSCQTTISVGDDEEVFTRTQNQINSRNNISTGEAATE